MPSPRVAGEEGRTVLINCSTCTCSIESSPSSPFKPSTYYRCTGVGCNVWSVHRPLTTVYRLRNFYLKVLPVTACLRELNGINSLYVDTTS